MLKSVFFSALFLLLFAFAAVAQSPRVLNVGIVAYDGVEILDFSGPAEVFGATEGFHVFVVGVDKTPLKSQGFVTITPEYDLADCPPTDILVFPGGGTGRLVKTPDFIGWVQKRAESTQFMMSVCTGAHILGKAGLLDGKEATTWHGAIESLQNANPKTTVMPNTRFIDNGRVITTAGVSAGIDGALHMVARIKGLHTAETTAFYMEYDKWKPEEGKTIESPFVKTVREKGFNEALKRHETPLAGGFPAYYEGEMLNLALDMAKSNPMEAETLLRSLVKVHPSASAYEVLGDVLRKQGKKAPSSTATFVDKIRAGEVAWAVETTAATQKEFPGWILFEEAWMNATGYWFLQREKKKEALQLFQLNTNAYPNSANAYDSLADAYEATGEVALALESSEKCLKILEKEGAPDAQRAQLIKSTQERAERLKQK